MLQTNDPKVILITGCSSGFGLLFAARLAAAGHCVYATMRDLTKQDALLQETARRGGKVHVRCVDVNQEASIKHVVDEIMLAQGRIDVLINNAGYALGGFFEDLTEEDIRAQMETNFFGVQRVCRLVLPCMRQRNNGLIINMSSIAGQTATLCLGAYNASKWALEGFSESLYYETAPFGIKVVLVEPGSYPTQIFTANAKYGKNYLAASSPYYQYTRRIIEFMEGYVRQLKRDPEHVARLVERIINTPNPRLRYASDFAAWARIVFSKITPPWVYSFLFKKIIFKEG